MVEEKFDYTSALGLIFLVLAHVAGIYGYLMILGLQPWFPVPVAAVDGISINGICIVCAIGIPVFDIIPFILYFKYRKNMTK
jgi:hypothetical protein